MAPIAVPELHLTCIQLSSHVYATDLVEGSTINIRGNEWKVLRIIEAHNTWDVRVVLYERRPAMTEDAIKKIRSFDDLQTDLASQLGSTHHAIRAAVRKIMSPFTSSFLNRVVAVTGHSLGAAMASLVGATFRMQVVAVDNPGVGGGVADPDEVAWLQHNCVNYLARPNIVNILHPQVGEIRQISVPHIDSTTWWHTANCLGLTAAHTIAAGTGVVYAGPAAVAAATCTLFNAISLTNVGIYLTMWHLGQKAVDNGHMVVADRFSHSLAEYRNAKRTLEIGAHIAESNPRPVGTAAQIVRKIFSMNPLKDTQVALDIAAESTGSAVKALVTNVELLGLSEEATKRAAAAAGIIPTASAYASVAFTSVCGVWSVWSGVRDAPAVFQSIGALAPTAMSSSAWTSLMKHTLRQHSCQKISEIAATEGYRKVKKWPDRNNYIAWGNGLTCQVFTPLGMLNPCAPSLRNMTDENKLWESRFALLKGYELDDD
ncbi:hypothetical protein HDU93_003556 [Gonapodya sp. JEL0774]|nr:hypothetical protein HDU93_003556 [Gonapodya sp. JEL0774]